ncbi:MAG: (4Fe-4S)-binding protein [Candidatus Anoxymicrobium japonicum]|uniref:(4Fe-4S)-binding protein n=1 Tax=Candidatus Anoxymicrobium japonicum TaxID=2013648 RepID=A0A2N3G6R1_9ACTN|nr:MAG: (4Fe-4S)-binding protein [Candidatus Anoxymicrobium japonicum]
MEDFKFSKDNLAGVIGALEGYQVFAPAAVGDVVRFKTVEDPSALSLDYANTNVPAKELMFPETETLFKYTVGGADIEPVVPDETAKRLVFGIRPCDALAYTIVDNLYGWDFPDPYYQKRRESTVLFGLACGDPATNCFCPSLGGGPGSEKGLDAIMFDLGEAYYVKTLTDKGLTAAKAMGLEAAGDAEKKCAEAQEKEALAKIKRSIDTTGIPEKLPSLYDHPFWEQFSDRCLGCGICTFLCPTCHCFDIQDEIEAADGRRARMWDTCMFPEYTVHTSGHNPRPTRKERTRNRVSHKYSYFPEKFDVIACVGCGRCINYCPVNIDILDVLEKSRQAEGKEAKTA